MPRREIRAHYEQLPEIERSRIIELKEVGLANRRIVRHLGRSDAANRRYWQEWVENGRFQGHDGSGRPRATEDRKDRLIVRSDVTAFNSSSSTIRGTTSTRGPTMTIHRHLIEQNLRSYRLLHHLLFKPARCRARLQRFLARSDWKHADWGPTVVSNESCFQLCSDDDRRLVWRIPGHHAYPAFSIAHHSNSQPGVIV
ncbi:HTH_Tnp_Tc3_2 domain-containing protein [Trichonephila clavipes]|nr:HTH_Tnp_Tc3_2 domain-containing protein [Trichonephila clavipes]